MTTGTSNIITKPPPINTGADAQVLDNRPAITVNVEKFEPFLAASDSSEEQKAAYLQAIWDILVMFAQMGFVMLPEQQAQALRSENTCGQAHKSGAERSIARAVMVHSDKPENHNHEAILPDDLSQKDGV